MKNQTLLVIHDHSHKIEDYIKYLCLEVLRIPSDLMVILDGKFNEESKEFLHTNGIPFTERNYGNDFQSWREEILAFDPVRLSELDNLILLNDKQFGPISPIDRILLKMSDSQASFWTVSEYPSFLSFQRVQPNFVCFTKKIINSPVFLKNWKLCSSRFDELTGNYWNFLKRKFISSGHIYQTVTESLFKVEKNHTSSLSQIDFLKLGWPFVEIRLFIELFEKLQKTGSSSLPLEIVEYISNRTNYPVSLIKKYVLFNVPPSQYKNIFQLNFIGSEFASRSLELQKKTVALIFFAYFEDLVEVCCKYILSFEETDKIVIVSPKSNVLTAYRERLSQFFADIDFRIQKNRGRNEAAYFITCKDVLDKFDYICLCHDKKLRHLPSKIGEAALKHCFENCLGSKGQVNSIINVLGFSEEVGILTPPTPLFSVWSDISILPYGRNKELCQKIVQNILPHTPFDPQPVAPYGSVFWVKKGALRSLLNLNLTLEDFPEEPVPVDGTILHALERLYPSFCQASGFATGWVFSQEYFPRYIEDLNTSITSKKDLLNFNKFISKRLKILVYSNRVLWKLARPIYIKIRPFFSLLRRD